MKTKFLFFLIILIAPMISHAQKVAIKTNLAYWGTTTPNIGVEFGIGKKSTIDVSGGVNLFKFSNNRRLKHWLMQPEYRYWLCDRFNGHFFGIHALAGQFNIGGWDIPFGILKKLKNNRYQGFAYGIGLSYGYQWILNPHWNFGINIGGGYALLDYDKYPCANCGTKISSGKKNYFGPTKAALSLIYFIK